MKKKEETKYLDKEWKEMNVHLKAFLETGDQHELHKFRVQIKKLRAMLTLLEGVSKNDRLLKDFKPVKKIFKDAGHIRDAHTSLELSERYELKNETFEHDQQKAIEEGTASFRGNAETYLRNIKETYHHIKKNLHRVNNRSVAEFYKRQLEQVAVNLTVSGFTEDMHTNRKLIKILVYNHKLADKALKGTTDLNIAYLDKLQEAIGQWHDNMVAAELFSSPGFNDKPIITKINRKNAGVKRSIVTLAEDFLKKAILEEKTKKARKKEKEWALR